METHHSSRCRASVVITYQTYVVRTPKHTILIDTCTGEDKGYPPPMDFPKQPWLDGLAAAGLRFGDIDYVFCTHLHIDHTGWNTMLRCRHHRADFRRASPTPRWCSAVRSTRPSEKTL
jgi:glyoxylase-like metal-dependent hydrolase (beta-lactamase superfamily II)